MSEAYTGQVTVVTNRCEPELRGNEGELIASFMLHRLPEAMRAAACWNACEGLPTEVLEHAAATRDSLAGHIKLTAQREELLVAAEQLLASFPAYATHRNHAERRGYDALRAAIANVKGGAL